MVTYSQVSQLPFDVNLFVNLAAGLFILPFFLFSAYAGLVADNMDKALLIRRLKILELLIMACAAAAIMTHSYVLMLVLLFLMGTQSAFFGPVKYSLLPQILTAEDLVRGNAWVEVGTFVSILLGTIGAGLILTQTNSELIAAISVVAFAVLGVLYSRQIPPLPPIHPVKKIKFTPLSGAIRTLKLCRKQPAIWVAIIAISWFWFVGATYLTQFANFSRVHLQGDATVVSLLLVVFSVGIAIGSMLCTRLSRQRVEIGVVPIGLVGLMVFGIDLYWAIPELTEKPLMSVAAFVVQAQHYRLLVDLLFIGISGGVFIVPLYAFVQARAIPSQRAQMIAANNILNALFMVVSALMAMVLLGGLQWQISELFLALAAANAITGVLIFGSSLEFRVRVKHYVLSVLRYRVSIKSVTLPYDGAVILVCAKARKVPRSLLSILALRPIIVGQQTLQVKQALGQGKIVLVDEQQLSELLTRSPSFLMQIPSFRLLFNAEKNGAGRQQVDLQLVPLR
ncbi:MFS transporter [Shewanella waksmanii]|uniref:MFS transporter n=1 Tax=Shewanella waksmanii TaxID=213783 RepID=UPI0037354993